MAQQIDMIRNLINHIVYKKVRWNITKCTVLLKKYWDPKSTNWCHLWTIVIKLVLEFSQSSPLFCYTFKPPTKLSVQFSEKRGLLTVAVLVCYCPKNNMPFYLQNHAIGFNCILLVRCMLDFVIYNPKWSYNLLLYISLLETRTMWNRSILIARLWITGSNYLDQII